MRYEDQEQFGAAGMRSMNGANLVSRAGRADRAFTLVEMLVAVGAVALVSVGLAAVFQTVGRTVTTGKRVSALTQQAAVLESQMREDFKNMSREGILVIRHQYTLQKRQGANAQELISVSRFQGDPVPARPRRIDEIMFFANGEYQTSREDLIPGRAARSRAARIYYGHGQKATPRTPDEERNFQVDVKYNNPTFGDLLNDLDNISDRLGEFRHGNVNRYASSWNLIRHATLLARPASVTDGGWPEDRPVPAGWGTGATLTNLCSDSTFQIAGQPAANSIFRSINEMFPMAGQQSQVANAKKFALFWDDMTSVRAANSTPRVGSGVVDIAATDLDEVSMVVNGSFYSPGDKVNRGSDYFAGRTSGFGLLEAPMPLMNGWIGAAQPAFYGSSYVVDPQANTSTPTNTTAARMQAWMVNALPVPSGYSPTVHLQDQVQIGGGDGVADRLGFRIRCEDDLPDVRGTMDYPNGRAVQTWRNNKLSVGLSKVAARCSEFVVEWSWGQTYPLVGTYRDEYGNDVRGQTIWYGRTLAAYNPNGTFSINRTAGAANPDVYRYDPGATYAGLGSGTLVGSNGKTLTAPTASPAFKPYKGLPEYTNVNNFVDKVEDYTVPDWLIHGVLKWRPNGFDQSSLISYFGYFDPTFKREDPLQPPSIPWAWPKMVRVTLTLADASDPSIEQTFQYVFDLPPDQKP